MASKQKTAASDDGFYAPAENGAVDKRPTTKGKNTGPADGAGAESGPSHLRTMHVEKGDESLTADAGLTTQKDGRQSLDADIARIRAQRKPFGAFTQKLAYVARPGYHRHWFSDEPGRVDEAKSNGWAHVHDKEDKPVKRVVGRSRDGGAMYGYLLELPSVFWDEDMAAKHDAAQARIDEIKKNPFRAKPGQAQKSDADKFYSAKDEPVRMTQTSVRSAPST